MGLCVAIYCTGCIPQASLKKKLEVTRSDVEGLAENARTLRKEDLLVLVSKKLLVAFDDVIKTKNPLKKPYLVAVFLCHYEPDETAGREEILIAHIEWFENRFVPHLLQFTDTDSQKVWVYDFQNDYYSSVNAKLPGVRFYTNYWFGREIPGSTYVSFEEGMVFLELARAGKLRAQFVDADGMPLSNEILIETNDPVLP